MLEVHEFEYVRVGDEALLRLAGLWPGGDAPADCRLATGDDTFEPLPQSSKDEKWRAAWSLPLALLESNEAEFALVQAGGERLELPRPIEHGMAAHAMAGLRDELERERARADELDALLGRLRARIETGEDRLVEVERRAEELRDAIRADRRGDRRASDRAGDTARA
jgi:hypothetical protein